MTRNLKNDKLAKDEVMPAPHRTQDSLTGRIVGKTVKTVGVIVGFNDGLIVLPPVGANVGSGSRVGSYVGSGSRVGCMIEMK